MCFTLKRICVNLSGLYRKSGFISIHLSVLSVLCAIVFGNRLFRIPIERIIYKNKYNNKNSDSNSHHIHYCPLLAPRSNTHSSRIDIFILISCNRFPTTNIPCRLQYVAVFIMSGDVRSGYRPWSNRYISHKKPN